MQGWASGFNELLTTWIRAHRILVAIVSWPPEPQESNAMSVLRNAFFRANPFAAPRRPRHRILRIVLGTLGVAVLLALLFVSVFIGIAMLGAGMLLRLRKQRGKPVATPRANSIDADYRVLSKAQLPLPR